MESPDPPAVGSLSLSWPSQRTSRHTPRCTCKAFELSPYGRPESSHRLILSSSPFPSKIELPLEEAPSVSPWICETADGSSEPAFSSVFSLTHLDILDGYDVCASVRH